MGDWIPIYSQTKALFQLIAGDSDGAVRTVVNFYRTCPVVSQAVSLIQLAEGDPEGAKETFRQCYDTMGGVANGIPVVGHIKGTLHYLANDNEGGDAAMKAASHTAAVTVGGAMGMAVAGPAGAVMGGIAAGTTMDATISMADSEIHNERRMYGYCDTIEKINTGTMTSGDVVDTVAGLFFDGMAGYAGGQAYNKYKKCKQTKTSVPESNAVADSKYEHCRQTKESAPKSKTVTNSKLKNCKRTQRSAQKSNIVPEKIQVTNKGNIPNTIIQTCTAPVVIEALETIKGAAQLHTQLVELSDAGKLEDKGAKPKTRPSYLDSSNNGNTNEKGEKEKTRPSDSSNPGKTDKKGERAKTKQPDSSNNGKTNDKGEKAETRPSDSSNKGKSDEKGEKAKTRQPDSSNTGKSDDKDYKSINGKNRRSISRMRSSNLKENKDINVPLEAPFAVKVKSIKDIKRGMHIKWERKTGYTHHALITDINTDTNQIQVIHFTSANLKNECNINDKAIIKQEWLHFDSKNLLRLEYNCRLSPENAIENAQRALKLPRKEFLKKYNLLKNNCEHLITYFVTGSHHSFQAETVKGIMKVSAACGLSITPASKTKTTELLTKSDTD